MGNLGKGVLRYLERERLRAQAQAARLAERVLSLMAVLGLTCVCIGLPLHLAGRALNDLTVARVGAYMLVIGILLIVMRIIYWLAEEIVGRGLESMAKEKH